MIETLVTDLICTTCGKNLKGEEIVYTFDDGRIIVNKTISQHVITEQVFFYGDDVTIECPPVVS